MRDKTTSGSTTIVTLASNRPDFIELQLESFKTFFKGHWEFIVLNNATKSSIRNEISAQCKRFGVAEIKVRSDWKLGTRGGEIAFRPWGYANPNLACSYGLNWFWHHIRPQLQSEFLMLIDSDMFLSRELDVNQLLFGFDLAFVPQYRGELLEVYYPWNGLVFARLDAEALETLDWHPGSVGGFACDVGGQSHHWLERHKGDLRVRHITALTVYAKRSKSSDSPLHVAVNGNWNSNLSWEHGQPVWSFQEFEQEVPSPISWRTVIAGTQYVENDLGLASEFLGLEQLASNHDFPDPWYFDLIGVRGESGRFDGFVFHYKSGSNYQPWATSDYNARKTSSLMSLLRSN